jgi:hypothetical protein
MLSSAFAEEETIRLDAIKPRPVVGLKLSQHDSSIAASIESSQVGLAQDEEIRSKTNKGA